MTARDEQSIATDERIGSACREMGLSDDIAQRLCQRLVAQSDDAARAETTATHAKMAAREAELMRLLGASSPDRIVHDLRNLLNEVALLKAAADLD